MSYFLNSFCNKPQLITAGAFEDIATYLLSRDQGSVNLAKMIASKTEKTSEAHHGEMINGNTYKIVIDGALTYKATGMQALCGSGLSYQSLKQQADLIAANPEIENVVLWVSSPGGEAYGCFSAAEYFKKTIKATNKNIITYIDESACSAAYAWACIADEVIINPEAETGSIGVVVRLTDQSKALDKAGIKPIYITAGADKVPFNDDHSFKEEFLEKLQASVDKKYSEFVDHVHTYRSNMSVETIKGTQANTFEAEEALELGLVDQIMSVEQFDDYISNAAETQIEAKKEARKQQMAVHDQSRKLVMTALKNHRLL